MVYKEYTQLMKMLHSLKKSGVAMILLLFVALAFTACKKNDVSPVTDSPLTGDWVYNRDRITYKLSFSKDHTFSYQVISYGAYGLSPAEPSSTSHFSGTFTTNGNELDFATKQLTWWDKFYDMQPKTEASSVPLFDKCSFTVKRDILVLDYLSYPADAPVATQLKFIRASHEF